MIRHIAAMLVITVSAAPVCAQGTQDAVTPLFTVTQASAPVYKAPTTASPVIGQAPRGTVLDVGRELGSWVRVPWPSAPDRVAYLHVSMGTVSNSQGSYISASVARTSASVLASSQTSASTSASASAAPHLASQTATQQSQYVGLPSHTLGVGAVMTTSDHFAFGGSARFWTARHVGAQLQLTHQSFSNAASDFSTINFAPSITMTLRDHVSDYLSFRPYVGGGPTFAHTNARPVSVDATAPASKNVMGYQIFGGGELTLASLPQVGVSVDVGYHHAGESFEGVDTTGLAVSAAGHWYFR
jgi:hypothetical protein